jgi:hypothetical protein
MTGIEAKPAARAKQGTMKRHGNRTVTVIHEPLMPPRSSPPCGIRSSELDRGWPKAASGRRYLYESTPMLCIGYGEAKTGEGASRHEALWSVPLFRELRKTTGECLHSGQLGSCGDSAFSPGFQHGIVMRSHLLPSCGHSLDKTARRVGGWSSRRIVDRHHRMTLDGKGTRQ